MNDYQTEQWDTLNTVLDALGRLDPSGKSDLRDKVGPYLEFRKTADRFLSTHFGGHCNQSCYENHLSACCSKDDIITFWADVVINALFSNPAQLSDWAAAIKEPLYERKCIYLGSAGCRWHMRPLMCVMFLCDPVLSRVFAENAGLRATWEKLQAEADGFRRPDKPVLFDWLETFFMHKGFHSPLMYINKSPGLMRIKKQAGWYFS
jgi:hypothetical protein